MKRLPVRPRSLRGNTLVYGVAMVAERLITFLTLPVLTKSLSVELYAVWSQVIVVSGLLTGVAVFHMHTAYVNFFTGTERDEKQRAFQAMLRLVVINCLCVIAAASLLGVDVAFIIFGDERYGEYTLLTALFLATEALFQMTTAYLRAEQRITRISAYMVAKHSGRLGVLVLVITIADGGLALAILMACVWQFAINVIIYVWDIRPWPPGLLTAHLGRQTWAEVGRFALPLFPLGALIWMGNFFDRFLIIHFKGIDIVAPYAVAFSLAAGATVFYSILGYTLYPNLAHLWNSGRRHEVGPRVAYVITVILFLSIPAVIGLTVLRDPVITLFTTDQYRASFALYLMLGASLIFFGAFEIFAFVLLVDKKSSAILIITIIAAATNLVLNLIFIPAAGLEGAALAKLLANAALAAMAWSYARQAIPLVVPWSRVGRFLLASSLMGGLLVLGDRMLVFNEVLKLGILIVAGGSFYLIADWLWPTSVLRGLIASGGD